jgi:hypothetical protein
LSNEKNSNIVEMDNVTAVFKNDVTGKKLTVNIEYNEKIKQFNITLTPSPKESIAEMAENNEAHVVLVAAFLDSLGEVEK